MDKYFTRDEYETDSPYLSGLPRKAEARKPKVCRGKSAKSTYEKSTDPLEDIRNVCHETMLNNIRKQYLTMKLRKVMAVELLKNRVGGDLKQVIKRINEEARNGRSNFVVLGGGPRSLTYCTRKKTANNPNHSKAGFSIEIDVRGYIPEMIEIDTQGKRMSIRAVRVSGAEKVLGILAPSISALEKLKIHPPKGGLLILQYAAAKPSTSL